MRNWFVVMVLIAGLMGAALKGFAADPEEDPAHVILTPAQVKWKPVPQIGPGIERAVLSGDPDKAGSQYVMRYKLPDGTKVAPHWHPGDELLTVLSGTFYVGVGSKFDQGKGVEMPTGAFEFAPRRMRHYTWCKGETVIQLNGIGPYKIFFVNKKTGAEAPKP